MEIFKSDKVLWIVVASVIVILVIFGITSRSSGLDYKLTVDETLQEIVSDSNVVNHDGLKTLNGQSVVVDLRNQMDYEFSHYNQAINLPMTEIMSDENMEGIEEFEKQGKTLVLYGSVPRQAAGTMILLKQLGVKNVKMFDGTFEQLMSEASLPPTVHNEFPLVDTTVLTKKVKIAEPVVAAKPAPRKQVVPVKEEPSTGGGC